MKKISNLSVPSRLGFVLCLTWLALHLSGSLDENGLASSFYFFWWRLGTSLDPTHGWWVIPIVLPILFFVPHLIAWATKPYWHRVSIQKVSIVLFAALVLLQLSDGNRQLKTLQREVRQVNASAQDQEATDQLHDDLEQVHTDLTDIEGDLPAR
jgi:hypothetical protein